MFAIIRTGGKQYKVQPDQVITIERLPAEVGETLSIETVLMVGEGTKIQVGNPFVQGSIVKGVVLDQDRAEKVIVFKKRRRHNYRRKQGHRQNQTVLGIIEISAPNGLNAQGKRDFSLKTEKKESTPSLKKEGASKTSKKEVKPDTKKISSKPEASKKDVKTVSKAPVSKSSEKSVAKTASKKAPSKSK